MELVYFGATGTFEVRGMMGSVWVLSLIAVTHLDSRIKAAAYLQT